MLSRRHIWLGFSACAIVLLAGAKGAFAQIFYQGGGACVPEIDPTTAISGLMLAAGGAMLLVERYRRRN